MGMNIASLSKCAPILAALSMLSVSAVLTGCGGDLKKARESYRVGDYPRALRLFEAELDAHPASFEARYGYAVVLQEISLKKKALGEDDEKDWNQVVSAYE